MEKIIHKNNQKLYNKKFVLLNENISHIRTRYFLQNFKNFKNWDIEICSNKNEGDIKLKRKKI